MNDSEQWNKYRAFGAVDWTSEKHSVIVVDQAGKVIEDFEIEHSAWMFLQRFPSPELLAQAGKRQWQKFLHSRRLWGSDQGPRRMEIFAHATEFGGSAPTAKAKSLLALSLVQMLFVIEKQLAIYRQRIEELFARHPDHDLFGSLPGAGPKIAPRLLSEIGDDRQRFDGDAQNLQCLSGTAPVTKRSGKYRHCHQRWACDKHLRHAIHLFAEQSLLRCPWAQIYYQHHRQKDRSHANALRRLGHRWLKIIYKMWIDRTSYDPSSITAISSSTAPGSFN